MTIYVHQDGADFYIYDLPACEDLIAVVSVPIQVGLDLAKAQEARRVFESQYSNVEWPDPFA